jgi:hypothetical protein
LSVILLLNLLFCKRSNGNLVIAYDEVINLYGGSDFLKYDYTWRLLKSYYSLCFHYGRSSKGGKNYGIEEAATTAAHTGIFGRVL